MSGVMHLVDGDNYETECGVAGSLRWRPAVEGNAKCAKPGCGEPLRPFRHGNRNTRNIYFGGEDHFAVVVGPDEADSSRYVVDALNAYWAAGHRPGEPT